MKTLIAIPCMDMIHADFVRALLGLQIRDEVQYTFAQSSLIYDARNQLARVAMEGGFDRVLWLDSDMSFDPTTFWRLHMDLDEGRDCVSGLYFGRRPPYGPTIYKDVYFTHEDRWPTPHADCYTDYPADEVFPIKACGFGCVMMTTDLIRRVHERFGPVFSPVSGFGEDLSFCLRASEVGGQIWCDSSIKCGHVGLMTYTEESFHGVSKLNT